jgi:hypothetical protein
MLDPWDNWYYPLPFLIALTSWETITTPRPPVLSLAATILVWAVTQWAVPGHGFSTDAQSVVFLIVSLPALIAIAGTLYAPGWPERLAVTRMRPSAIGDPA